MRKKLFCLIVGCVFISGVTFATAQYWTSCGTSGYTVSGNYFDSEDEYWDYLVELNDIDCGTSDIPTIR